ncbi:MAG TPA: hypothetical protein VGM82_04750 [Gemmatimonadaceae bacterium]|jgi:hypothetical protein
MPKRHQHERTDLTYASTCELLEHALCDGLRPRILDALTAHDDFQESALALRSAMRSHTFPTGGEPLRLQRIVQSFDTRARRAGLHVLESWDYVAQRFASEITPVLMLDRCALDHVAPDRQRASLSVLLDHYFMSVLGLVVARAWDEGDPNENLERATALLNALKGDDCSNCRFVDDVETLMLTSVSHYHPDEHAYETITRRFDVLTGAHRRRMSLTCAAVLGGHLRWGLRFMYHRDISLMREDNVVDYPFVIYGLLNLLRDYDAGPSSGADDLDHVRTIEGVLNALSADPAFATGKTPRWLRSHHEEHAELRELLLDNRDALLADFAAHRPTRSYSPLGFDANFLCNTVVAMIAIALGDPSPHPSLNAMFTRYPYDGTTTDDVERQAGALTRYAIRVRLSGEAPLVVYDSCEAAHAFNVTNSVLRQTQGFAVGSA